MVYSAQTRKKIRAAQNAKAEQSIITAETENMDLKRFFETIRKCTDLKELTPTIVNTLIKRIEVHNSVKADGVKRVPIDICFTAVGLVSILNKKEMLELMRIR